MEPFIGQIIMFGGNFAPRGWAFCEGQLLAISSHSALFSILGTIYGGDGRTTFGLPDLRGRFPTQQGNGPGLPPVRQGEKGGTATNQLITAQLPAHGHPLSTGSVTIPVSSEDADQDEAAGTYLANGTTYHNVPDGAYGAGAIPLSGTSGTAGNNQPVNNLPPFLGLNFIIALQGTFPSRS